MPAEIKMPRMPDEGMIELAEDEIDVEVHTERLQ
jgi:hypothetical protein